MNTQIDRLKKAIEPFRQEIINHKVYSRINDIEDLRIFMQYHVFAVWDFMSLLKTLQNNLTCTSVPWFPVGSADTRQLINEIVVGEESDVDLNGTRKSHFELYLDGMDQCGASTLQMLLFIEELKRHGNFEAAYRISEAPLKAKEFVDFTFEIIDSEKNYLQSAIFTFGREDLIPDMFVSVINAMYQTFPDEISIFKYYIERHIEVDGGHHSHLALQMTANLCGSDDQLWLEAEEAVIQSLKRRIGLWDGIYEQIEKNRNLEATLVC